MSVSKFISSFAFTAALATTAALSSAPAMATVEYTWTGTASGVGLPTNEISLVVGVADSAAASGHAFFKSPHECAPFIYTPGGCFPRSNSISYFHFSLGNERAYTFDFYPNVITNWGVGSLVADLSITGNSIVSGTIDAYNLMDESDVHLVGQNGVFTVTRFGSDLGNVNRCIYFGGCNGAQGTLTSSISNNVPEPGTVALFGMALVGLMTVRRRSYAPSVKVTVC